MSSESQHPGGMVRSLHIESIPGKSEGFFPLWKCSWCREKNPILDKLCDRKTGLPQMLNISSRYISHSSEFTNSHHSSDPGRDKSMWNISSLILPVESESHWLSLTRRNTEIYRARQAIIVSFSHNCFLFLKIGYFHSILFLQTVIEKIKSKGPFLKRCYFQVNWNASGQLHNEGWVGELGIYVRRSEKGHTPLSPQLTLPQGLRYQLILLSNFYTR